MIESYMYLKFIQIFELLTMKVEKEHNFFLSPYLERDKYYYCH